MVRSPAREASFTDADATRVRDAMVAAVERYHVPGLAVGVVDGDDLVFSDAVGHADIEAAKPMRAEMRQRIASITKTMIGLCAMALVDERRLSLDAKVPALLPEVTFVGPSESMTVWHLLTHTSGIGEAPTLERLRHVANPDRAASEPPGDFGQLYPDGIVVEAEPGTKWAYANNAFALLGEIISRAEASTLQDVLERRIFAPLGMRDSDIFGEERDTLSTCYHRPPSEDACFQLERAGIAVPDEPLADGHNIRGKFTSDFNKAMAAAGGVQSTIPDMAKYASALLNRSAGIVRPETFDQMTSPQFCPDARLVNWGLSFSRTPRARRTLIGHGGAYFGGWNSNLAAIPDVGIAVIQHMNVMLDEPAPVFASIIRAVLDAPPDHLEECAADPTVLESAAGIYELSMPGPLTNFRPATRTGRIEVTRDGSALMLQSRWGAWKNGIRLVPVDQSDPLVFAVDVEGELPKRLIFTRNRAGALDGLRFDELVHMHRRPGAPA